MDPRRALTKQYFPRLIRHQQAPPVMSAFGNLNQPIFGAKLRGEWDAAVTEFEKALFVEPDYDAARQGLEKATAGRKRAKAAAERKAAATQ